MVTALHPLVRHLAVEAVEYSPGLAGLVALVVQIKQHTPDLVELLAAEAHLMPILALLLLVTGVVVVQLELMVL